MAMFGSLAANAQNRPQFQLYKYNNQIVAVPIQQKKQLDGVGMDFINKVSFETVTDEKGLPVKKASMWIKGCGKTYIDDSKILDLKEGTMIRVRMGTAGKCDIKSWEKF